MQRRALISGVVLGAVTSMVVLMSATAFAGTGVGAVFNLGQTNNVDATSTLAGSTAGKMLQVTNTSSDSGAAGIGVSVGSGTPPFILNSTTKVTHLNADLLDGRNSTYFLPAAAVSRVGPISVAPQNCFPCEPVLTTLATIGQFTFIGSCWKYDSPTVHQQQAVLEIKSSVAHGAYADLTQAGAGTTYGSGDMAADTTNVLADTSVQGLGVAVFTPVTGEALSADGHQVSYDIYMAQSGRGAPAGACAFGGSFIVK
jgi:hypothetical protein